MKRNTTRFYLLLHLAIFVLSLSTICSKFAASHEFMSFEFIALYAGVILALGVYALIWQQILKKIPLVNAFVNKSATLIWSLIWGVTLFGEHISANMLLGIAVVFIGVILVITGNQTKPTPAAEEKIPKEVQDE